MSSRCCAPALLWARRKPSSSSAIRRNKSPPSSSRSAPTTVLQQPQHGTGHAMQVARRAVGNAKLVDRPSRRRASGPNRNLARAGRAHRAGNAAATILTAVVSDPQRLRPHRAQIGNAGRRHRRRIAAHRRAARHQRDQLQHLLLHARQALAGAGAGEAQQQAPRAVPDRRDRRSRLQRRNRARAGCARSARSPRLQHARRSRRSRPHLPRMEAQRADECTASPFSCRKPC